MSNYSSWENQELVHEKGHEREHEVPCPAHCRGGLVEVHGQETDCITCEGFGTILV